MHLVDCKPMTLPSTLLLQSVDVSFELELIDFIVTHGMELIYYQHRTKAKQMQQH